MMDSRAQGMLSPRMALHGQRQDSGETLTWAINLQADQFRFLQDHRFQDMAVLPGAAYVEMALAAASTLNKPGPVVLRNVKFERALLLSEKRAEAVHLKLTAEDDDVYRFCCSSQSGSDYILHASLQVKLDQAVEAASHPLDDRKAQCTHQLAANAFYDVLEANGNQYDAQFRRVAQVWQGPGWALSELVASPSLQAAYHLHPALLDACIQTLTATYPNKQRTFVFTSFEQASFSDGLADLAYCYAELTEEAGPDQVTGQIQLLAGDGKVVGRLGGVQFQFLAGEDGPGEADPEPIAISATFTAEPVEDALNFWMSELDLPIRPEFAPYNQVYQQLLDPNSLLAQNKTGFNVTLLRLEDWLRNERKLSSQLDAAERERLFADQDRYTLPNHLEVAHLNKYETEYVYKEIFVDLCYMKHGITIKDGDTIIDIGANIGLFSLFALQSAKDLTIYAFEPSPPVYRILDTNLNLYGSKVKAYNCGVSDSTKEEIFTFYEKSSVFSSFSADEDYDGSAIRAVIENMVSDNGASNPDLVGDIVDDLMEGRLASQTFTCQLRSLSEIIAENDIQQIDLLKLDAEKSELPVLQGIREEDWPRIRQLVMEVHDQEGPVIDAVTQILRDKGFELAIEEETYLHNSGLYNIFATRPDHETARESQGSKRAQQQAILDENVDHLIMAAKVMAERSATPHLVGICPPSPDTKVDTGMIAVFAEAEKRLEAELDTIGNLYFMNSAAVTELYPVENYYDAYSDRLGHIPYTPEFFGALGTTLVRKYEALRRPPYKVIVLDCDNTLWGGVAGEDGPAGLHIDENFKALQSAMLSQIENGLVLCLCSKNVESDVWAVFEQRDDMVLKREHIVAARINWEPKSQNIRSLAEELQLGLDSFIFIDDNPVEIAEVQVNCPEVLTLQLPAEVETMPTYLKHWWAFDHLKATAEDKKRTAMYRQNAERQRFQDDSMTLTDFLAGLNLQIDISAMAVDNLDRVSQLTQRTNQFNFTTIRRSAGEIQGLVQSEDLHCLVVQVSDRFGDYGLVGAMLYRFADQAVMVDTFLLSCRVLGRGVEHAMLARMGHIAREQGLSGVDVEYRPTPKNQPALKFIESVGKAYKSASNDGYRFSFPAAEAANISYNPEGPDAAAQAVAEQVEAVAVNSNAKSSKDITDRFSRIAASLFGTDQILKGIETQPVKERPQVDSVYVAPDSTLERSIAKVWQGVLGIDQVGIHDNFFEMGGTSLIGVRLIAQLRNELSVEMSIVDLFESPTIHMMKGMLSNGNDQAATREKARQSRGRAARRRERRTARSKRGRN